MPLLNFGQPTRGVMQMSYVVQDIHGAIQDWTLVFARTFYG